MRLILRMWNYNNTHLLRKIFRFFKWQILSHASFLPVAAFFALAHPSPIPSLCLLWEVECIIEDVVGSVDGEKKACSLPKSASLLHFGPDRSAINTRASSIELPECATLSLSLHTWFWKQCDVKSSKIPYLLLRQMLKKRVVETCDWRGKKEPYFPQKWITKPSSCCGA
jgi:hypothetical protein